MSVDSIQTDQSSTALSSPAQPVTHSRMGFALQVSSIALLAFATIWGYAYWKIGSWELVTPWLNGERILFHPRTINLGNTNKDQTVTRTIQAINATDQPLIITGSQESCGCLSVDAFPITIAPGERNALSINLHTSKTPGHFKHSIKFFTSSQRLSSTTVTIEGTVK